MGTPKATMIARSLRSYRSMNWASRWERPTCWMSNDSFGVAPSSEVSTKAVRPALSGPACDAVNCSRNASRAPRSEKAWWTTTAAGRASLRRKA